MKLLKNTIINFHVIHDEKWMEQTLCMLNRIYNLVPLSDIMDFYYSGKELKNACHITFDDGDISFYEVVFPLLKKYNIPASIFVSPLIIKNQSNFWFQEIRGYDVDRMRSLLRKSKIKDNKDINNIPINSLIKQMSIKDIWELIELYKIKTNTCDKSYTNITLGQLIEIRDSRLVNIGAHTLNHPILRNESKEKSYEEIITSVNMLSEMLQTEITSFAYPNGLPNIDFDIREIKFLQNTTIKIAFSTESKGFSLNDNPYSIPRKGISKGNASFILIKLVLGTNWHKIKTLIKGKQENDYRY